MERFYFTLLTFTLLPSIYGRPVAERTQLNAKYLRVPQTPRQLVPYPAARLRPEWPFVLPTGLSTEASSETMEATTHPQLELEDEAADEDLVEDVDPIAADAEEDDSEPLPVAEPEVSAKSDEAEEREEDENADILPERKAGPTPSKRYWFFRK